jgi:hypothetical protein
MNSRDDRIREIAHRLWEEDGRPPGEDARHWQMAESAAEQEEAEEAERKIVEGVPPGETPAEDAPLPPTPPPFQR